jgi:hypothetical protein
MLIPESKGQNEHLNGRNGIVSKNEWSDPASELEGDAESRGRSGQQSQSGNKLGGKINLLKEKFDFLRSTNFKLLRQM